MSDTPITLDLSDPQTLARVQQEYLDALPRIHEHAQINFRYIRDPGRRDDAIQDVIGIGWKHWLAAIRHGKDPKEFVSAVADFAVRQVRSGRKLTGQERAKDVMSPVAQRRKNFTVKSLPSSLARPYDEICSNPHGQEKMDVVEERLTDNTITPPPDQAAFREYWRLFLERLGDKKREIVVDMAGGEGTNELAAKHKVSAGRISQVRREAAELWRNLERDPGDDCCR